MSLKRQQQLENEFVIRAYGRKPVEFVRGRALYLYDDEGKRYHDFLSGIGAVSVGHSNPRVTAAIIAQAERLLHVSNYFYVDGRGELAAKLNELLSTPLCENSGPWKTFFANSGAEANEGAIKLARKHGNVNLGGATTIISARRSFHGRTLATSAATGQEAKQSPFAPMPTGFVHAPLNDFEALAAYFENGTESNGGVCAVMLECIQGEGGVWPCNPSYLKKVRELTAKHNALLIIDEVQTGFFRTGGYPFSYGHYDIVPDVVTMAKGIANGVPLGAFAARGALGDLLSPGEHGSTFGGNPLAVAAANATLNELMAIQAAQNVKKVGDYFADGLVRLPLVTEVRGRGLMRAAELSKPIAFTLVDEALENGLVINAVSPTTLRFLPPLIADLEFIYDGLEILEPLLAKEA